MLHSGLVKVSGNALARLLGEWTNGAGPTHRRLSDHIRLLILDGRLPLGGELPGERELAHALTLSRTTVTTTYSTLREQGYVASRPRSRGTIALPGSAVESPSVGNGAEPIVVDFSRASPAAPGRELHQAYSNALEQLPRYLSKIGYSRNGIPELQEAVARRYRQRGLPTSADQIYVTSGALHALGLLAKLLLRPRDRVLVDAPTYPHALDLFRSHGIRIGPVPLTDSGWDLENLRSASRESTLAYLIPDFHNPTGFCLSERDREVVNLDCPVIVDETMAELALDAQAPPPFATSHPTAISIGSASKTFWGGLRVGWIRAPISIVTKLAHVRTQVDLGTSIVDQLAAVDLLDGVSTTLPQRLDALRAQRAVIVANIADRFPAWQISNSVGGLSFWVRTPEPVSSALASVAPFHGLRLAAGPRFGSAGTFEHYLRLPYSLDSSTIGIGMDALERAYEEVLSGDRRVSSPAPLV